MKFLEKNLWIGKALGVVAGIAYLAAVYSVMRADLVPHKYLLGLLPVSAVIVGLIVFACFKYSWVSALKSVGLVLLSLLVLFGSSYVYMINASTFSLLGSVSSGSYSIQSYSIVASKNSSTGLKTNNKTIGYIKQDPNASTVVTAATNRTSAVAKGYDDLASLSVALQSHQIDSAVLLSSYLPIISENDPALYGNIKVLGTFNIRVKNSTKSKVDIHKPFVVYISGVDTYGSVATVSRSDVNILAVVNPKTHKILLVNTPRDYYVQLHGTTGTRDKLTHAGIYGINMSKDTMQDLYGTKVDYTLRINFTSLLKIVDSIGGVNVYSDNNFTVGKYHFVRGYNQLNAKQALAFSRERHSFADGDRQRGKDQQRVIEAIIAKMSNPTNLVRYPNIMKSLEGSFQTNASRSEISAILNQQANSLGKWQTESISVTGADSHNSTYSMGSMQLYVMEPNKASVDSAKAKISTYKQ